MIHVAEVLMVLAVLLAALGFWCSQRALGKVDYYTCQKMTGLAVFFFRVAIAAVGLSLFIVVAR